MSKISAKGISRLLAKRSQIIHAERQVDPKIGQEMSERDRGLAFIAEKLIEAGYEIKPSDLTFKDPEAASGVMENLKRLGYNPKGLSEDPTYPWWGSMSVQKAKSLIGRLKVPSWAEAHRRSTIQSISLPTHTGWITPDRKINKAFQQLLLRKETPNWNDEVTKAFDKAVESCSDWVIKLNEGEKIRLRDWSYDRFLTEMKGAIDSSSPGYPYNGFQWTDEHDGKPLTRIVYDLALDFDKSDAPRQFIAGERSTGDGGTKLSKDGSIGQCRLTFQDEANAKRRGHELAYPLKKGICRAPSISGQHGIQAASRSLKNIMSTQSFESSIKDYSEATEPQYVFAGDVGKWDAAQTHDLMDRLFWKVIEKSYDLQDTITRNRVNRYRESLANYDLHTPVGSIKPNFLPSGDSCTTVIAFVNHYCMWFAMNELYKARSGKHFLVEIGLQGDDVIAVLSEWNSLVSQCISEIYTACACELKTDSIADKSGAVVFLNEVIKLDDELNVIPNTVFPRWNMFWSERASDIFSRGSVDRLLLQEILLRVPHPTQKELLLAGYVSKMDRISDLDGYEDFLRASLKQKWKPRSWLIERIAPPMSQTLQQLLIIESEANIERPEEDLVRYERGEAFWCDSKSLQDFADVLWLSMTIAECKSRFRWFAKVAKSRSREWKAFKISLPTHAPQTKNIKYSIAESEIIKNIITERVDKWFLEIKERSERTKAESFSDPSNEMTDKENVHMDSFCRVIMTLNAADPHFLQKEMVRFGALLRDHPDFLSHEHRKRIEDAFLNGMGFSIQSIPIEGEG